MEKRTCKLCFRSFTNGRALGGHMRSHMLKLQTIASHSTTSTPPPTTSITPHHHHQKTLLIHQLQDETDLVSSASSSEEDDKGLGYGLRENPKKSFRLVDPEFSSFAVDACSVVQDRESSETGTGSSKNLSRRRSKRNRKSGFAELPQHLLNQDHGMMMMKKVSLGNPIRAEFVIEPEPVSSVSDTIPEEDVAWCLMMLSRGIRTRKVEELVGEEDEDEYEDYEAEKAVEESDEELKMIKIRVKRSRGKYQCGTCNKFFRSYQALGGHRASHKKIKGCNATTPSSSSAARPNYESDYEQEGNAGSATILPGSTNPTERRIHECPVCFRVFGSGQALGGHKRSHIPGLSSTQHPTRNAHIHINTNSTRFGNNLIDLNLPAPMDDEDQIELSAVSDGDFI